MKLYPAILFIFLSTLCQAQKQANNWYFGNKAGLNFNGANPVAIGTGQLNNQEGCSGFSDPHTGQLLFYTEGDTVWNRNNQVMPNGHWLGGCYSSTQGALAVPRPGSTSQYYIFTVGAWAGMDTSEGSFKLNLLDMTLDGGLGDVTVKNQTVLTPVCEKLTATLDCNGVDYWVVVHKWNSSDFYSYKLTNAGLSSTPVISAIGSFHTDTTGGNGFEAIGAMKISPDGKKIALVTHTNFSRMELFDFDNSTGIISNAVIDSNYSFTGNTGLYGLSFSPDNSKLYVSIVGNGTQSIGNVPSEILQYDLSSGVASTIIASRTQIHSSTTDRIGNLQLCTNGKIYVAKASSPKLDVIVNPNNNGLGCTYVANGIQQGNSQGQHFSSFGLPNFVELYNTPTEFKLTYNGCGGTYTVSVLDTVIPLPVTVLWNFGDPASGANNSSNLFHPTHTFSTLGTYTITLTINAGCMNFNYTSQIDMTDSFQVDYGPDLIVCTGNSVQLNNSYNYGLNYVWTPASNLSCTNCPDPVASPIDTITYIVSIDDGPGCHDEDTITINLLSGVVGMVVPDTSICPGNSVQLIASGGVNYSWVNEPTLSAWNISNPIATPTSNTTYEVIVSIPGCTPDTVSVTVDVLSFPAIDAGPDLTILTGNSALIEATSDGASWIWNPGYGLDDSTILQPTASPTTTTTYTITADNGLGCLAVDSVVVFVNPGELPLLFFPNAFTPNGDGNNDLFDYFNFGFEKVWLRIYNRWGQLIYETDLPHDGWDGMVDDALPAAMGVYVYYAIATSSSRNFTQTYKGNFTLIR
ncbi:MAG TPA: hypothetical protein DCQ93_00725 [Bacteroidetes bacterium]|nr:hypothetical protein [Bacteroidota bacterium]